MDDEDATSMLKVRSHNPTHLTGWKEHDVECALGKEG